MYASFTQTSYTPYSQTLIPSTNTSISQTLINNYKNSLNFTLPENSQLLESYGYKIQNVSWEDTARNKNSCWGPNISDMTLRLKDGTRMPMIRKPNFMDVTYDVDISKFKLPLHNTGIEKIVSLKEYLKDINKYVGNSKVESMLLDRDEKILTQVQTCLLPCKDKENVEFTVNLYNYQSRATNPKVLVITVSKNGTSTQILTTSDNNLYFNNKGESHYFKAERLGNVREKLGLSKESVVDYKEMSDSEKLENCLMVIQVPLKGNGNDTAYFASSNFGFLGNSYKKHHLCRGVNTSNSPRRSRSSDIEDEDDSLGADMAVLSTGSHKGKYMGVGDDKLVRDDRYPIRCTYQYYRVSDDYKLNETLVKNIVEQLDNIKNISTGDGSLVMNTTDRITEPKLDVKPVETVNRVEPVVKEVKWDSQTMLAM
jgi:hypothetical protein